MTLHNVYTTLPGLWRAFLDAKPLKLLISQLGN
jgi:hypothetical protein